MLHEVFLSDDFGLTTKLIYSGFLLKSLRFPSCVV